MDGLLHDLHNWWRSLKRFAATVLIYVVRLFALLAEGQCVVAAISAPAQSLCVALTAGR